MFKELTLEEQYDKCIIDGKILQQEKIDIHKIRSMLDIAKDDIDSAEDMERKEKPKWNTLYKTYYDALHTLVEAYLLFDKVKSLNHQCLFAFLCIKHPELDLDWNFFEKIRTKRNGIHYYGSHVGEIDWKEINLQIKVYIKLIQKILEQKIKE